MHHCVIKISYLLQQKNLLWSWAFFVFTSKSRIIDSKLSIFSKCCRLLSSKESSISKYFCHKATKECTRQSIAFNRLKVNCTLRNQKNQQSSKFQRLYSNHTTNHNRFTALLPGPPGWASARRELLDFMVQGKINRGRHTDHPAGHHSIRTN